MTSRVFLRLTATAIVCAIGGAPAAAQVRPTAVTSEICQKLSGNIERAEMFAALQSARAELDDSAVRQLFYASKVAAQLQVIDISLAQMASAKCPAMDRVINPARFETNAGYCAQALASKTTPPGYGLPMSCKTEGWEPTF